MSNPYLNDCMFLMLQRPPSKIDFSRMCLISFHWNWSWTSFIESCLLNRITGFGRYMGKLRNMISFSFSTSIHSVCLWKCVLATDVAGTGISVVSTTVTSHFNLEKKQQCTVKNKPIKSADGRDVGLLYSRRSAPWILHKWFNVHPKKPDSSNPSALCNRKIGMWSMNRSASGLKGTRGRLKTNTWSIIIAQSSKHPQGLRTPAKWYKSWHKVYSAEDSGTTI